MDDEPKFQDPRTRAYSLYLKKSMIEIDIPFSGIRDEAIIDVMALARLEFRKLLYLEYLQHLHKLKVCVSYIYIIFIFLYINLFEN